MRRNQLIAAALATALAGVGTSAMACGTCGGYGYRGFGGYRGYSSAWVRPAPVGEFFTTRTFVRQSPLCYPRTIRTVRVFTRPAPVAERVITRRVFVQRRLAPVAEMIPTRTRCYTNLAPVGERIITRRAAFADSGYYGGTFGRVVTAPVRLVGSTVTWPFRRAFVRTQPEIIGERILVTRVATYPTKRHITKRHHAKAHKVMHQGKRHAKYSKRLAPVGERVVNMKCTIQ